MLIPKVQDALNAQINAELHAFYTYLSMSAYFAEQGYPGFAAWMRHHSDEEMVHAMKIYDYVQDRRGVVKLAAINAPRLEWNSPLEAMEDALRHEQDVTRMINDLVRLAREERDYATDSLLQWYVDEQVEEEKIVDDVIQDLRHIGDFGPGLVMLDRELSAGSSGEAEDEAGGAS
jgi:ferritin